MTQLSDVTTVTVQGNLDALQAQRDADWPPQRLADHAAFRQGLEDAAVQERLVKAGDIVAPFDLAEVDGERVVLTELVKTGPVVLIFFRFESCPACNAALGAYRDALAPALSNLGAHLVAISPQIPEKLGAIKHRLSLDFQVASDPEASLLHAFGIAFSPDEQSQQRQREQGTDLGELLGTGKWELPYPTAVVIDQECVVRFADVHPNWMVRTEASTLIEAVRSIV